MDQLENSLARLLFDQVEKNSNKVLYMEKVDGNYKSFTRSEIHSTVLKLAKSFIQCGLQPKDKVAILSTNCVKWAITDFGCLSAGLIDVPIYPTLLSNTIEFILKNSETKFVFVQNSIQLKKVLEIDLSQTSVEKIVVMNDDTSGFEHEYLTTFTAFLDLGVSISDKYVHARLDATNNDDVATLIYTSGTTGMPKGVMLSHKNILSNVHAAATVVPKSEDHVFLSFLPLSHIFERMFGHYMAMFFGATVAYAESIETVAQNMGEIRPTVMASVPRLYEKIYAKVLDSVEQGSPLKQKIFFWALKVGKEVVNKYTSVGKKPSGLLAFKLGIANKLVFNKLKDRVGGRLEYFVSGGGALMAEIAEFFTSAGLLILEGYGLTETSPVITVNRPNHFKFGFVGQAIPGVEIKIQDDGEILTRGPHVMKGYFKNEEATNEVMTEDGWFKTGDIGYLDNDGFLKITDRKKNIIVTSGGKNIAPLPIEAALVRSKYIEQSLMIGDKRKFCAAILTPSEEALEQFAKAEGINYSSLTELVSHEKVKKLIDSEVEKVNDGLARYESIKKYILLDRVFTIESGEMTPKLSIKKKVVLKNLEKEINELYAE